MYYIPSLFTILFQLFVYFFINLFTDKSDKIDAEGAQNDENPTIIEDDEDISEAVSLNITNHYYLAIMPLFFPNLTVCLHFVYSCQRIKIRDQSNLLKIHLWKDGPCCLWKNN